VEDGMTLGLAANTYIWLV